MRTAYVIAMMIMMAIGFMLYLPEAIKVESANARIARFIEQTECNGPGDEVLGGIYDGELELTCLKQWRK